MLFDDEKQLSPQKSICILVAVCILCLVPFLNKAFHIDDPLFIWAAKQIQIHPLNFYGFNVNWYGWEMPISEIAQNPPLASYYIALVAFWFGWSEIALHIAFLFPACAVVVGTYFLAKNLCERPLLATLITISTPVFLLSSTTVMCDILMLSFWITAVNSWRRGIKSDSVANFVWASLLITLCGLTKYYGISLILLLFAYSLAEKRKLGIWIFFLMIPLLILGAYQYITHALYGRDHLLAAASYALTSNKEHGSPIVTKTITGLAFIGGCLMTVFFYAPIFWRKTALIVCSLLILLAITLLLPLDLFKNYPIATDEGINWLFVVQLPLFILSGMSLIYLTICEYWHKRDSDALLIALWVIGTIVFTLYVNWTVNGRSLLPIVPVLGILVVWKLRREKIQSKFQKKWQMYLPLIPAFIIALLVTWSDYKLANASREASYKITSDYRNAPGKLWFEGHWGFQYYMELVGNKALDFENPQLANGDIIVIPSHQSGLKYLYKHMATPIREYDFATANLLTMNENAGAGFYADLGGGLPLPFAVGHKQTYKYFVFKMVRDKKTRFTY